jgi:HEAT repeat protein
MIETGDLGEIKRVKVELKGVSAYLPDSEYFREIAEKFLRYAGVEVVDEGYDAVLRVESEGGTGKVSFISGVIEFSAQFRSETFITAMTELILKIFGIQPLKKVLKRESRVLRAGVARALGKIGDSRAVEALIEALKDEDSDVRKNVAWALGKIGDARAVEALIEALKDEDSDVRRSVAWALDGIGWKPGNDEERVLYYIAKRDWGRCVKMGSFAVEFLIERLKDKNSDVRIRVAEALGKIGDARAVEALIETLKDEDRGVRENSIGALVEIAKKDLDLVDKLIKALRDEDSYVRGGIAKVLGNLGWEPKSEEERVLYYIANGDWDECVKMGAVAVEFLIERLKDRNSDVRRSVAEALGKIGDARAVGSLIETLKDDDENVRESAKEALVKILGVDFEYDYEKWKRWWKENEGKFLK